MVVTLRFICEQCTHLKDPQLEFISGDLIRHREIILRDLQELLSAASDELDKAVTILAGSIFEEILYSFLQSQEAFIAQRRGTFTFDPTQSLQNYVDIFHRWFGDILPDTRLPDFVVRYRDLVHINSELNSPPDVCARASRDMLRVLDHLLGELSQFAGPQRLQSEQ